METLPINQIINEDCLAGIQKLPDESVDFVFCDYPFKTADGRTDYVAFITELSKEVHRVMKNNSVFLIVNSPTNIWKTRNSYDQFMLRDTITLVKRVALRPAWHFGFQHNTIMTFIKGTDPRAKWNGTKKNHDLTFPTDVIQNFQNGYRGKGTGMHNQAMPIDLVRKLVQIFSNEGDLVLDPFMGSGTTAVACIETNRVFIGYELNPKHYATATARVAQASQPRLL